MAVLTVQAIARTGVVPAYAAVNSSDTFANDGKTYLHVKNGGGGSTNVTITSTAVATTGLAAANQVVAVAAGAEKLIGPFPIGAFNDSSTGLVTVGYSVTTTVTAGAFQLPS